MTLYRLSDQELHDCTEIEDAAPVILEEIPADRFVEINNDYDMIDRALKAPGFKMDFDKMDRILMSGKSIYADEDEFIYYRSAKEVKDLSKVLDAIDDDELAMRFDTQSFRDDSLDPKELFRKYRDAFRNIVTIYHEAALNNQSVVSHIL